MSRLLKNVIMLYKITNVASVPSKLYYASSFFENKYIFKSIPILFQVTNSEYIHSTKLLLRVHPDNKNDLENTI